jgi:hypothetical protein
MSFPVYRLLTGRTLYSFGDPIGAVPVFDTTLARYQEQAVRKQGLEIRDVAAEAEIQEDRYYIFEDDLFFSEAFFAGVLRESRQQSGSQRFILAPNSFNERFSLPDSPSADDYLAFNFFFRNRQEPRVQQVVVPQRIFPYSLKLPTPIVASGTYSFDQCAVIAARMASPFHLLQVNIALNISRTVSLQDRFPRWLVEKVAPVNSWAFFRAIRSLNRIGKRCKIHPTALIEGSVIEDDVIIGANAIVRLSRVGRGSHIQDNVSVMQSVVGEHNVISNGNHLNLCLTYDDVFLIHGPYQFSVFGRSSAVFAVINCDYRLDQKTIAIPTDCGLLDSRQPLLGIAYGHRSKVGGGNIIAAGRIVPNDRHVLPPASIITKFEVYEPAPSTAI